MADHTTEFATFVRIVFLEQQNTKNNLPDGAGRERLYEEWKYTMRGTPLY